MRVRLLADVADHVRSYAIGDVCDLPDDQAERWIRQGLAFSEEHRHIPQPEAAALDDPDESATLPRARKR